MLDAGIPSSSPSNSNIHKSFQLRDSLENPCYIWYWHWLFSKVRDDVIFGSNYELYGTTDATASTSTIWVDFSSFWWRCGAEKHSCNIKAVFPVRYMGWLGIIGLKPGSVPMEAGEEEWHMDGCSCSCCRCNPVFITLFCSMSFESRKAR